MSAFTRSSICEHCSTHFNTHVDCYQCEPDSDYCEFYGDNNYDCEESFGRRVVEDIAGVLIKNAMGLDDDRIDAWLYNYNSLLDRVQFHSQCSDPERRERKEHVWLVRAVELAFRRLGEPTTLKNACFMVHRYLPANAKRFKTQADLIADLNFIRKKLADEHLLPPLHDPAVPQCHAQAPYPECTCKKKPSKKKPSKKQTLAPKTMQVARPGYNCHCYSGGNGCPHM